MKLLMCIDCCTLDLSYKANNKWFRLVKWYKVDEVVMASEMRWSQYEMVLACKMIQSR